MAAPANSWPPSRSPTCATCSSSRAGRFAGLFVIRPSHNPLGPLDFDGIFDERSDRPYALQELVDRGYEDAYRQFMEPVVAVSGEQIATGPTLDKAVSC